MNVTSPVVRSAALALVSVAAALAFGRIFAAGDFVGPLLLAAVIPHAVGLVGRVRAWRPVATTLAATTATLLALTWASAGAATTYGLPTVATIERFGHLLDRGWTVFRTGIAPVPPTTGVVLLGALAVAAAAITADALARRPDATIAPLGPTLVLFVLTGTLGTDELRIPTTIAYVAAALVHLAIANATRLESRRTWFTGRRLASDASIVRSAATVGAVALLVGLVVTPLIPGVDSAAVLRYRNSTGRSAGLGDYAGLSPLVDLRARLTKRSNIELFRVTSPVALPWRLIALDRFDGTTWSLASEAQDAAELFESQSTDGAVRQRYSIRSLADQWLPAAYRPVDVSIGNARAIPESATLIAPNQVTGLDYDVRSRIERQPSAAAIARTAAPVPESLRPSLLLPSEFPANRRRQALDITSGAATPWARAIALQQFFTDGSFTYDLDVRIGDGPSAIDEFLTTRRGFCQQFAAAFAALARAAGLPSRVVVGFTPGAYDAAGKEYVVRGRDAHAWAEVWFAGLGWRTFEPTPAGPQPGQADPRVGSPTTAGADADGSTPTTTPTTAPRSATTAPPGDTGSGTRIRDERGLVSTAAGTPDRGWSTRTVISVALGILVVVALMTAAVARIVRPGRLRRRRRSAATPGTRIHGAWSDALDACQRAGLPVSGARTPAEQVRALNRSGAPRDALPPLAELAEMHAELEYSDHAPETDAPERAWRASDQVRDALLVGVGAPERVRRAWRPTSGDVADADTS